MFFVNYAFRLLVGVFTFPIAKTELAPPLAEKTGIKIRVRKKNLPHPFLFFGYA
jgi:hypothetical protein